LRNLINTTLDFLVCYLSPAASVDTLFQAALQSAQL
jgi:hypothetical protein